jgi:hypothetical protein
MGPGEAESAVLYAQRAKIRCAIASPRLLKGKAIAGFGCRRGRDAIRDASRIPGKDPHPSCTPPGEQARLDQLTDYAKLNAGTGAQGWYTARFDSYS